ncbi:MAG: coiled coil domain-containing protein [Nitrospirae bacterium]|nr:coiled coil domain-containing protein [Nitrospirota bacterium]MBI5695447.1 coiled coil domain-containing protein [Nitrospirota bacterium]
METRKAYIEKLSARLKEWDARIDLLKAHAEEARADAKIAVHRQIAELKDLRQEAAQRLAELHEAGDEKWQDIHDRAEKLADDVKKTLKKAA